MLDALRRFFAAHGIPPCHVLVACSGGVDSTALLLALAELRLEGFEVTAGHVNHRLRGEESEGDEEFVRSLCRQLGIALHVAGGALDSQRIRAAGVEAAAREVRQARLTEIAEEAGARFVVTAHQKNDQAETVLMRLLSGTGLAGLRGIHAVREDGWIRPLLEVTREETEKFLRERGVAARLDRMNADPRFLRNRVRLILQDLGPAVMANLALLAGQAQQAWPLIEQAIDAAERSCTRIAAEETCFLRWPDDRWLRQALLFRHIRRLGSAREISSRDLERLAAGIESIKRISVTKELELVRRANTLVLRRPPGPASQFELDLVPGQPVYIPAARATITINPIQNPKPKIHNLIQLPEGAEPRFLVRNRRRGDRFQPLGMQRDKKLKDFLIDRKIGAEIRDSIPLLIWNGEIACVAGVEVSERFKVTSPGGRVYEVKIASEDGEGLDGVRR
ncbi:MAG TPA: tRNA lysidine(34) synthetase TilS [Thermoanaerobaculia bacterium]|nr:tRNA lysidine(34) synthetase TilS [Thermoanaerobaculia bacterium]